LFDEIQDKNRQLADASQHKSQFLANMSHELRTPLNAIIGVTEMLREDAEALRQDVEPLDRVLGAGRHLLALINDILDLSKIEAVRMELNLDTFALPPLIDEVVKTIEPLAAKNGNQVAVHCDAAIGTMHADQMRLRQAIINKASTDWIDDTSENDRDSASYLQQWRDCGGATAGDDIRRQRDQLLGVSANEGCIAPAPAIIDLDVATIAPAQLLQTMLERRQAGPCVRVVRVCGPRKKHPDPTHSFRLLRRRHGWPHHCKSKSRDELAAFHVWMAPAWQEIILRAALRSLAVMCPAFGCSPTRLLALMESANRRLVTRSPRRQR
jgi:hypothetical protein